jgi:hypothetical protein
MVRTAVKSGSEIHLLHGHFDKQLEVEAAIRDTMGPKGGIADIRFLLESRGLGGKCADLNARYVALVSCLK